MTLSYDHALRAAVLLLATLLIATFALLACSLAVSGRIGEPDPKPPTSNCP